jgi:hypothetical protein
MPDTIVAMIESLAIIAFTLLGCGVWLFAVVSVATALK